MYSILYHAIVSLFLVLQKIKLEKCCDEKSVAKECCRSEIKSNTMYKTKSKLRVTL